MKRCLLPISPSLPFSLEGESNAFGLGLQSLGLAGRLPSKSVTAFIAAPVLQAALHVTGLASDVSTTGLPSWRNEKQLHFFRDCRVPCGRGKVLAGAGQVLPPSRQRCLFAVVDGFKEKRLLRRAATMAHRPQPALDFCQTRRGPHGSRTDPVRVGFSQLSLSS